MSRPSARVRRRRLAAVVGVAAAVPLLVAAGIGGVADVRATPPEPPTAAGPPAAGSATAPAPVRDPACSPVSLEQRAAQVVAVGLPDQKTPDAPLVAEVRELGVGMVFLNPRNVDEAGQVRALVDALRAGPGLPPLVTTDEESGRVSSFRDVRGSSPTPAELGEQGDAAARAEGAATGRTLAAAGVDVDLAPVADLSSDSSTAEIGDRAFGMDPTVAADRSLAYAAGLRDAGVLATAKHFPGLGSSPRSSHSGDVVVPEPLDALEARDLRPFRRHVEAGVPLVMVGHAGYAAFADGGVLPASLDPQAYALLRSGLGFEGVAITDSTGMGSVNLRFDRPEAAVRAIGAGADTVLDTDGNQAVRMRDALVTAVRDGSLPESRLDEAVGRVLALKGVDARTWTCSTVAPAPVLTSAADVLAARAGRPPV